MLTREALGFHLQQCDDVWEPMASETVRSRRGWGVEEDEDDIV